jgi:Family of unknown function (DUF6536)
MAAPPPKPQLVGKEYVGYTLHIGLVLATLSLAALVCTICCIFYSMKESFDENYSLIILPSIPLYTGGHFSVKAVYTTVHFLLNLLGSLIVAASFYLQQLCASPSYQIIRQAVTRDGGDVPFGSPLPTTLSLFRRRTPAIWVWLLLLLTSLVMHLCLNGAIGFQYHQPNYMVDVKRSGDLNPIFFRLENWTNATASQCQTDLRSLLAFNVDISNITLIVDDSAPTNYLDYFGSVIETGPNGTQLNPNWTYIKYCFENKIPQVCTMTARWAPMAVFTGVLIVKSMVVLLSVTFVSHFHQPLYTSIGDILQLATQHREVATVPSSDALKDGPLIRPLSTTDPAVRGVVRKLAWWRLMLTSDWICYAFQLVSFGIVIFAIYDSTVAYFLLYSTSSIITVILAQGFGTPEKLLWTYRLGSSAAIMTSSQLTALVFLANSTQVWLAICVFCVNNHVTRNWLEADWRGYYMRQQKPRVTPDLVADPSGVRKPRKVSPLPYSATLCQLAVGALCHWLLSEAFFVVEAVLRPTGYNVSIITFYVTHSPAAIALGGLCFFVLLVIMTVFMCIGIRTEMPVMNGSVRVVLASCTRLTGFASQGIAWGEISESESENVAGFGAQVKALAPGSYGRVTIVGDAGRKRRKWF